MIFWQSFTYIHAGHAGYVPSWNITIKWWCVIEHPLNVLIDLKKYENQRMTNID